MGYQADWERAGQAVRVLARRAGNATVVADGTEGNNSVMAMRIRCGVDVVGTRVAGWVFHPDAPDSHLEIVVHHDGALIGEQTAAMMRTDLRDAGVGKGDHAFDFFLKRSIARGDLSNLRITAIGTDGAKHDLPVEPQRYRDAAPPRRSGAGGGEALSNANSRALKRMIRLGSSYSECDPLGAPLLNASDLLSGGGLQVPPVLNRMLASHGENPDAIIAGLRRDTWAIPRLENRENYGRDSDLAYWTSGYLHYRLISRLAGKHGIDGGRCYDFGGSSGRVCRNFAIQSDAWDVWLSDFRESSIEFALRHLPKKIKPFMNSAFPSLPLPDGYFDLVFACSVFTHINETEIPWLLELRRVLRVGGMAVLSTHNDATWDWLMQNPDDGLRKQIRTWRPDIGHLAKIPEGERIVVTHRDDDPYNCNVFHSDAYLRRTWGRYFDIAEIVPLSMGVQAVVVCLRTS